MLCFYWEPLDEESTKTAILLMVTGFILQADKFLKFDWLRPVVFEPNLKYLHVKITPVSTV